MRIFALVLCLLLPAAGLGVVTGDGEILRGDSNNSGVVDMSDWSYTVSYLFLGGPAPTCMDQADFNDDAVVDNTDAIGTLDWLFSGGPPPAPPGAYTCGVDPTTDDPWTCLPEETACEE